MMTKTDAPNSGDRVRMISWSASMLPAEPPITMMSRVAIGTRMRIADCRKHFFSQNSGLVLNRRDEPKVMQITLSTERWRPGEQSGITLEASPE
jgi:hypothetical protein